MKATHKMYYVSGGGTQYDGGEWLIKETPKTFTFIRIKDGFFSSHVPEKSVIRKEKERSHCLKDWEDGTYTIYPFQSGTPHYFYPV